MIDRRAAHRADGWIVVVRQMPLDPIRRRDCIVVDEQDDFTARASSAAFSAGTIPGTSMWMIRKSNRSEGLIASSASRVAESELCQQTITSSGSLV